jgi:hypothetical protein
LYGRVKAGSSHFPSPRWDEELWKIYGKSWKCYGKSMEYIYIYGKSMEILWTLYGTSMENKKFMKPKPSN